MKVLRKAFKQSLDPAVSTFVSSVKDDAHLISADICGSIAHVHMLETVQLIGKDDAATLTDGLTELLQQAKNGELELDPEYEDVHMNIEHKLEELIGNKAKLLHTARSRNDQVALDTRLYVLEQIEAIIGKIATLVLILSDKGSQYAHVVMPGYTHLQRAQPVAFSQVMSAFAQMLQRDIDRFIDVKKRTSCSPLGAGALAGSSLPIQPETSAKYLGFQSCFVNSIDAVTDRDFIAEFIFACSLTSVHLSQLAETLILWCTQEFGFITFSDAVTTTSSLMPQKKNPDPVEIVRAKCGSVCGDLVKILVVLKSLPIGYNRDLQETKPPAISSSSTLIDSLNVMSIVLSEMTVNEQATATAANDPELMATDLVEYLVLKDVPFRQAHEIVAEVVAHARDEGLSLGSLPLSVYAGFCSKFDADLLQVFDPVKSVSKKNKSFISKGAK